MKEKIAQFRFKGYRIVKSTIEIDTQKDLIQQLDVEFTQTSGINEQELLYKHTLVAKITNSNKSLSIEVHAEGYFEFDKDLTEKQKENFFNIKAPSILFPYVRAYITALTSLAGVQPPVILPTLNLSVRK